MKDYYSKVKKIMQDYPDTRDDDMILYATLIARTSAVNHYTRLLDALYNHKEYNLPSYESVTRARRKVQEQEEDLRGHRYDKRKKLEEEYREHYARGEDFVG